MWDNYSRVSSAHKWREGTKFEPGKQKNLDVGGETMASTRSSGEGTRDDHVSLERDLESFRTYLLYVA